jgi:hypothetical protein
MQMKTRFLTSPHIIGSGFFIVLALLYVGFEVASGDLSLADFLPIVLAAIPLLVQKRIAWFLMGSCSLAVSVLLGLAFLFEHVRAVQEQSVFAPTVMMALVGYLIIGCSIFASLLLIYAATNRNKREFSFP